MSLQPTPELLRHRPDHDTPKQSREKNREAFKLNSVVDRLLRNGDITRAEHEAAERFYRDITKGMHTPGLVSSYGERMGGSTPLSQLAAASVTPAERRTFHHNAALAALQAIDQPEQRRMIYKCLVEETPLHEASQETFKGSRNAASGAGKFALICAIRQLAKHYDGKYSNKAER
jgi:hypothetical protein